MGTEKKNCVFLRVYRLTRLEFTVEQKSDRNSAEIFVTKYILRSDSQSCASIF